MEAARSPGAIQGRQPPEYRLKLEALACVSFVSCKHRSLTSFKIPLINGFRAIGS